MGYIYIYKYNMNKYKSITIVLYVIEGYIPSLLFKELISYVLYCVILFHFMLCCVVLCCVVLYCVVLYYFILYCLVLYYFVLCQPRLPLIRPAGSDSLKVKYIYLVSDQIRYGDGENIDLSPFPCFKHLHVILLRGQSEWGRQ